MRRTIAITLAVGLLLALGLVPFRKEIDAAGIVGIAGNYLIFCGTVLVFYQIRLGVILERRRGTLDFTFGPVSEVLQPLELELKSLLDRELLVFGHDEPDLSQLLQSSQIVLEDRPRVEQVVREMLSFYERLAIFSTLRALDEDVLYDDKGLVAVSFLRWTATYRKNVQDTVHRRAFGNVEGLYERWDTRFSRDRSDRSKLPTPTERLGIIRRGVPDVWGKMTYKQGT